jgi:hypothetical protein
MEPHVMATICRKEFGKLVCQGPEGLFLKGRALIAAELATATGRMQKIEEIQGRGENVR